MKKKLPRLRQLSRTKIVIGVAALAILAGVTAWGLYVWRGATSNPTVAEVNHLIDKKVAEQVSAVGAPGVNIADKGEPNTAPPEQASSTSGNSQSSATSAPTQSLPASSNTSTGQQATKPTAGSPTSPVYPNDNGDTPQVTLTNPSSWKQVVSGSFTATAVASDSSGINRVVFMLRKIGQAMPVQMVTDTEFPYSAVINVSGLPNGSDEYTIEAQAFDNTATGNMASYRINIQN